MILTYTKKPLYFHKQRGSKIEIYSNLFEVFQR